MFDDERPGRDYIKIWVALPHDETLACARCRQHLPADGVAFFTRTRPADPFDSWCAECAYELVRWAGMGALAEQRFDSAASAQKMEALVKRGHR